MKVSLERCVVHGGRVIRRTTMMSLSAALAAVLSGCHVRQAVVRTPRLETEAELYLYLQPFPPEAARLSLSFQSVSARNTEGVEVPLELLAPELSQPDTGRQRLLAHGRLEAGAYSGFVVRLKRATLRTQTGVADLVVPADPVILAQPFTVAARDATVTFATLRYSPSDQEFEFRPSFTMTTPQQPIPQFTGFCTNSGTDDLLAFDSGRHEVASALTTGRDPRGIALDQTARRAYVALSGEDQIQVFDLTTGESRDRIWLRPGDVPRDVAVLPDGSLLVINQASNTASFVDPLAARETDRVSLGYEPWWLLVDRLGRRAYVLNRRSNTITVLDVVTHTVVSSAATEPEPIAAQLSRDGSLLYVIHGGSAYMGVFSVPSLAQVKRVFVGLGASGVRVDSRTDLVYVAAEGEDVIRVFDPFSLLPVKTFKVPGSASRMAIHDAQNAMFLLLPERRAIAVVDLTTWRTVAVLDVGPDPFGLAVAGERP
jgi:YVTN family beta-propeller protein